MWTDKFNWGGYISCCSVHFLHLWYVRTLKSGSLLRVSLNLSVVSCERRPRELRAINGGWMLGSSSTDHDIYSNCRSVSHTFLRQRWRRADCLVPRIRWLVSFVGHRIYGFQWRFYDVLCEISSRSKEPGRWRRKQVPHPTSFACPWTSALFHTQCNGSCRTGSLLFLMKTGTFLLQLRGTVPSWPTAPTITREQLQNGECFVL